VKGPTEVKGPTQVNFKQGGSQFIFAPSARELIFSSPTLKMMATLLNVVHYGSTSADPVSNAFRVKRDERKEWENG